MVKIIRHYLAVRFADMLTEEYETGWSDGFVAGRQAQQAKQECFICGKPRQAGSEWCADHTEPEGGGRLVTYDIVDREQQ